MKTSPTLGGRKEDLGAGALALELVQTAVAIEVSTRNNAFETGFDAWLEPAQVSTLQQRVQKTADSSGLVLAQSLP